MITYHTSASPGNFILGEADVYVTTILTSDSDLMKEGVESGMA